MKYTTEQINKILSFRVTHTIEETKKKFNVSYASIKSWTDPSYNEKQKEHQRLHYERNKEYYRDVAKVSNKERYKKDKEKYAKLNKQYYEENKEIIQKKNKEYYHTNKKKLNTKSYEYYKRRCEVDSFYKIKGVLRGRIKAALFEKGYAKADKTYNLIGCTPNELKAHLEAKFEPGMTWENHGKWHIDHIKPCVSFDLSKPSEQQKCFHFSNLQPLWAYDNLSKGIKSSIITKPHLSAAYTPEEYQKELLWYNSLSANYGKVLSSNKIVLTYQPHYYETENRLWKEDKDNLRRILLDNRLKYIGKDEYTITDREVLRGFKISGKHIGFSHFNPLWIRKFIEDYNIQSLYDPCGGWGHRLIGANKIRYIYNDLDTHTYDGCKQIAKDFNLQDKVFYNEDCSKFTPKEDYECVFTCPPYFNAEIYQGKTFKSKEDYSNWWDKTIKCSLKESVRYFAFVISGEFKDILVNGCLENGLVLKEEISLALKYNHFQSTNKKMKGEYLVVFTK